MAIGKYKGERQTLPFLTVENSLNDYPLALVVAEAERGDSLRLSSDSIGDKIRCKAIVWLQVP